MPSFPENLIIFLNHWPPESVWILMLGTCFTAIVLLYRLFGAAGLYLYIVVAIIGANIQVLKAIQFSFYPEPVALGTALFASTYLATDILAERYGAKAARLGIWLGFSGFLLFNILMLLTLAFAPLTEDHAGETMKWALPYHDYMIALFMPQSALFMASMIAYLTSQFHDVWLFDWLKSKFNGRFLWLRNNVSTIISAFIDNAIFSIFAWIVFNPHPLPLSTVFFTYILGTYWERVIIAILDTPFCYLATRKQIHEQFSRI